MATITIDLFPANTVPASTDILHSRTAGGIDKELPLSTLVAFLLGNSTSLIVSVDYNTLQTAGMYRNSSLTNSPDGTANQFVVIVSTATATIQTLQIAFSTTGIMYTRTYNGAIWTAWKTQLSDRGYDDTFTVKNLETTLNWQTLTASGLYHTENAGQTNSPDGTTNKDWHIIVNARGADNTDVMVMAIRQDTQDVWIGSRLSSVWSAWTCVDQPTRGYQDAAAKNLSTTVNWQTLVNSGFYNISGAGQTNSPDGTASGTWFAIVNTKGGSTVNSSIFAINTSTLLFYVNTQIASVWQGWHQTVDYTTLVTYVTLTSLGKLPSGDDGSIDAGGVSFTAFQYILNRSKNAGTTFSKPIPSTYGLIYTTNATNAGGVMAADGTIYFIPISTAISHKISPQGVVSTYSTMYGSANFFSGGVLDPNGNVHFTPYQAQVGLKINASAVISTYSLVYTNASNATYQGSVMDPNGNVHFVPGVAVVGQKVSSAGVVSTYSLIYTNTSAQAYFGGVMDGAGNIHFVPYSATVGQKVSSAGVVSTYSLVLTGVGAYKGGVLMLDGSVLFVPAGAGVFQKVGITGIVSTFGAATGYSGAVLAPDGYIYFVTGVAGNRLNSALVTSSVPCFTVPSQGAVLDIYGNIWFVPNSGGAYGAKLAVMPATPYNIGVCISGWLNKF